MTTLHRVLVSWSGPPVVGAAVNVLHYSGSDSAAPNVAAIRSAYATLAATLPSNVTIQVPNSGDSINDVTGELTGVWTGAAQTPVVGSAAGGAAAGVGACATWSTGGIINGRRLRGRTFAVPLSYGSYDTDGTFLPATMTILTNWVAGMLASGPLAVWHRPTTLAPSSGNSYGVTSGRVRDKVAVLRSRRD